MNQAAALYYHRPHGGFRAFWFLHFQFTTVGSCFQKISDFFVVRTHSVGGRLLSEQITYLAV